MVSNADRFVAFDCETTGLNPEKDGILTIGAVVVQNGDIVLDETFDAIINDWRMTSSVLVHGITPAEAAAGGSEAEVVGRFLDFVGSSPLVGHHVGFDKSIVAHAAERLGRSFDNPAIDTMEMALALEKHGAFGEEPFRNFELDTLCDKFGIEPHDRHTAPGDAFLTAQVFMRLQRLTEKHQLPLPCLEA